MAANINRFRGEWHIWWVQGFEPVLEQTGRIVIGAEGAQEPFLSDDGEVCVGFAIYEPDGTLYASSDEWGPLALHDGQLRWDGTDKDGHPLRMYMSVAEAVTQDDKTYFSLYGTTLHGDPDQVAVWGANDSPPP